MWNVTMIPFFLLVNIGVKENDWKYGPEMIYDVRVDDVADYVRQPDQRFRFNVTAKLHCRTTSVPYMRCQFKDIRRITAETSSPVEPQESQHEIFDDGPFGLKFGLKGLEGVIVSAEIQPSKLDAMVAVATQFSAGVNLSQLNDDEFEIMDNFTTRNCKINCVLSSRDIVEKDTKIIMNPYDILLVSARRMCKAGKKIQRTRNVVNCDDLGDYIFGNREIKKIATSDIDLKVEASKSHMIIRGANFTSWIEKIISIKPINVTSLVRVVERITLTLDSIVPASGPIPTINDARLLCFYPPYCLTTAV